MDAKQQFVNATKHVVGYNCFKPGTNEPWAASLMPGETCWLSEDEQRMTANAPRDASQNPFVNGFLQPVTDERPIPAANERPIAGIVGGAVQRPPAPRVSEPEPVPESIFEDTEDDRRAKAAAEAARQGQIGAIPANQVVEPEQGALHGDMGGDTPVDDLPTAEESTQTQETGLGGENVGSEEEVAEETAADHREETGAAIEPSGDPEEGEFAEHEEVGDPEAPAAEETESASQKSPRSAANGTRNARQRNRKRRR